jgi:hypothetical protein
MYLDNSFYQLGGEFFEGAVSRKVYFAKTLNLHSGVGFGPKRLYHETERKRLVHGPHLQIDKRKDVVKEC